MWSVSKAAPLKTWWPSLDPDVCALAAGLDTWDIPNIPWRQAHLIRPPDHDYSAAQSQVSYEDSRCSYPQACNRIKTTTFYVCPRDGRTHQQARQCGGLESFYCSSWGCETTGNAYWNPVSSWDLLKVVRNHTSPNCEQTGLCNPLNITFSDKGCQYDGWATGRQWGLRYYKSGYDKGLIFTIRLKVETLPAARVGPNTVL